jgi:hypothetical protein
MFTTLVRGSLNRRGLKMKLTWTAEAEDDVQRMALKYTEISA